MNNDVSCFCLYAGLASWYHSDLFDVVLAAKGSARLRGVAHDVRSVPLDGGAAAGFLCGNKLTLVKCFISADSSK